ncbi:MAG: hypothetical protein C4329_14700 [Chitinophagaceae bacterium]
MKQMISVLAIALSLAACNGAGDRQHDMPMVTDSVSYLTPRDTHIHKNDTKPTTNNNAYNTDSTMATGANGRDTATKNQMSNKGKKQ